MRKACAGFTAMIFVMAMVFIGGIFLPKVAVAGVSVEKASSFFTGSPVPMINIMDVREQLEKRGFTLNPEYWEKYKNVPFSKDIFWKARMGKIHGQRGVLWFAPEGMTINRLLEIFGTDATNPPFFEGTHAQDWWHNRKFANEKLKPGWHLTTVVATGHNKEFSLQEEAFSNGERMLSPVEAVYLSLMYQAVHGWQILTNDWTRTNYIMGERGVAIGFYSDGGLVLEDFWLELARSDIGYLVAIEPEGE